jgi:phenylpropionate dioxygenase-like ring-hydroxylating dioxygenase large terminal subunit
VRVPQIDPGREVKFGVPAYHCEERYGYAWVALDEPLYDIPEIPEAADARFRRIPQFYEIWECAAMRFMENAFDAAHIAFVHRKTFGDQADPSIPTAEIKPFDGGFRFHSESQVRNPDIQKKNLGIASDVTTRRRDNTYWMPFNMRLGINYPNGLTHTIVNIMTPVDDTRSMLVQFCYRNDTEEQAKAADIIAFDRAVTLEDRHILEGTESDVRLVDHAPQEMSMTSDRPGLLIRRMLHDLLVKSGEAAGAAAADARDPVAVE